MKKLITYTAYTNAMLATLMGVCTLTMHNILIGIAFLVLAKNMNS